MNGVQRAVAVVGVRHGFVLVVADAGVVFRDCCWCVVACMPRLSLLLSKRVPDEVAIIDLRSRSSFSCCCCCGVPVALGGKAVMVTKMLIENVLMSLLMIKDC